MLLRGWVIYGLSITLLLKANLLKKPSTLYKSQIGSGHLQADADQQDLLPFLDALALDLETPAHREKVAGVHVWRRNDGEEMPKGLYLYGTVGRGKSMLMQLLFDAVPVGQKRRVHFHPFMEELHERMHDIKAPEGVDLMLQLASDISAEARLLCFDEFYVTNLGDAMLLGRLLEALFACGVTLCATSNWAPDDLYQDGHNSGHFHPFMKILKAHTKVLDLGEGADWRRRQEPVEKVKITADQKFLARSGKKPVKTAMTLIGHEITASGFEGGVALIPFSELCDQFLGRGEYMDLCRQADEGVIISDVPELDEARADAAMRFVVLVDLLYENQIPTHVTSETALEDLCTEGAAAFAFQRTLSRLCELERL